MGTEVPEEYPVLEPAKWYCVTVDRFWDLGPATDCAQAYIGRFHCCRIGAFITDWYAAERECKNMFGCCIEITAERIVCISGPFDTQGDCEAVC